MKQTRLIDQKKAKAMIVVLLAVIIGLLTACGARESHQRGVDGYVYVAQTIKSASTLSKDYLGFSVTDNWLYYITGSGKTLKRLSVKEVGEGIDFARGENVLTVSDILAGIPQEELSVREYSSASLAEYAVDASGGIYCILFLYQYGDLYQSEFVGTVLSRQSSDGQLAWCRELAEINGGAGNGSILASDNSGGVYVLADKAILSIDENGKMTGKLAIEGELQPSQTIIGSLMKGDRGAVYYTVQNLQNADLKTFVINGTGELQMVQVPRLVGSRLSMELYEGIDGILVNTLLSDGSLYQYDYTEDALIPILKWGDSNLVDEDIEAITQLDQDRYLVSALSADYSQWSLLLLTKTPADELPEREVLILASLFPGDALKRSVVSFNLSNDRYHISIESYGADFFDGGATDTAYTRLDASLLSQNPPDILDLTNLNVGKYAENGMLEDLYAYMGEDSIINVENYLDNLLEGYTMNGKLVSLPRIFHFRPIYGIMHESQSVESWTMPVLMELTGTYPETVPFGTPYYYEEYLLETFCAPYYLEQFVDWEQGTCNFDSDEFCSLLRWAAEWSGTGWQSENVLLGMDYVYGIEDYPRQIFCNYGEETVILGFPSADGKGILIAETEEALGLLSASLHKDGAWEFLKYFLTQDDYGFGFPTRKDLLDELVLDAVTPRYRLNSDGSIMTDMEGNEMLWPRWQWTGVNGVKQEVNELDPEQVDAVMRMIEAIDFTPRSAAAESIVEIISEETKYLFDGSKTAEEVCGVIQNKAELLLQEGW